jgi:hypothetical protein
VAPGVFACHESGSCRSGAGMKDPMSPAMHQAVTAEQNSALKCIILTEDLEKVSKNDHYFA